MNDNWKSAFDQIHAENQLKEHTKEYLSKKIYSRKTVLHPLFRQLSMAAASLAILILIGGTYLFLTPTAYISIDVNPSIELGINRFDRIVSVDGYNEDGENLAESLHITFMEYQDALEQILSSQSIEDYLSQDAVMSLTVAGDNETQSSEILGTVESCTSDHENIHCHSGDTKEMHEAHEEGLSFGKYQAYLILKELDASVSLDDVRNLTMREIYDLIDSYNGNQSFESNDCEDEETHSGKTQSDTSDTEHETDSPHNKGHNGNENHHGR